MGKKLGLQRFLCYLCAEIETKRMKNLLKRHPLTTALLVVIWVLCMMPVPETPLSQVRMIDKWTHFVMFGTLAVVAWWECKGAALTRGKAMRRAVGIFLMAWLTGGLVELAQAYLTNGVRSGEWMDFVADGIGALLGQPIGMLLAACRAKGDRAA